MKIAVLGAGAWGTAIAINLAQRHAVALWARDAEQCAAMTKLRVNARYLPGFSLSPNIDVSDDLHDAVERAEFALIAVTAKGLREVFSRLGTLRSRPPLV